MARSTSTRSTSRCARSALEARARRYTASTSAAARTSAPAQSVPAGTSNGATSCPTASFICRAANLRVADVPEAQIDASPDLDFSIDGRKIEVTGKVVVPYAKIQPDGHHQRGARLVRRSDRRQRGRRSEQALRGREHRHAGARRQVNIDAMGLAARLTGSVTVRSGYDAITRGTGELSVAEGKYTAYARKLDIQRGRLIFTGGPIDDPGHRRARAEAIPRRDRRRQRTRHAAPAAHVVLLRPAAAAVADRVADPRRRLAAVRPEPPATRRLGQGAALLARSSARTSASRT